MDASKGSAAAGGEALGGVAVEVLEVLGDVALAHLKALKSGEEKVPNSALIRAALEIVRGSKVKAPPASKTAAEIREALPFEDPDAPT